MEQEGQKGQGAFTPGPWVWFGGTLAAGPRGIHLLYAEEAPGLGAAAEANAHLIAAAPELLEALVAFIAEADNGHVTVETDRKARAAILKATRGSL